MAQRRTTKAERDGSQDLCPDTHGHFASEAEFVSAVEAGIASLDDGPAVEHATVVGELYQIIHGKA